MKSKTLTAGPLAGPAGVFSILVLILIIASGCSTMTKTQAGTIMGGLAGAAVGAQFGPPDQRGQNALIGAGIGLILGYIVGNEWDKYDDQRLFQTLEYNRSHERSSWVNPDTGRRYEAVPYQPYDRDGRVYRDVEIRTDKGDSGVYTAYRDPNGRWRVDK